MSRKTKESCTIFTHGLHSIRVTRSVAAFLMCLRLSLDFGFSQNVPGISPGSTDVGLSVQTRLNDDQFCPYDVAVDAAGNLYVVDSLGSRVLKVMPNGAITTLVGTNRRGYSGDGGLASSATLDQPVAVAVDASGNIYIADSGNRAIRKVGTNGFFVTLANDWGGGRGVAVDRDGNLFLADFFSGAIRKVSAHGAITLVAGNGRPGYSGDGGPAINAQLSAPMNLALDAAGNLYVAEIGNQIVLKISAGGIITTVAGNGSYGYSGDGGPATSAQLNGPRGIALDKAGNIYIADAGNSAIRKVTVDGIITTAIGGRNPEPGSARPVTIAALDRPLGIAIDGAGNFYIADSGNYAVRKVAPNGTVTTLVAKSKTGDKGGGGGTIPGHIRQDPR